MALNPLEDFLKIVRALEKNEVDYYFLDKNKFFEEVDFGNIIEYTYVKNAMYT